MKRLLLIISFALIGNSAFAIEESAKSPILLNLESEKAIDSLDNYQFLPEEIIDEYPLYLDPVEPEQGNDIPMQPLTDKSFNNSSHAVDGTSFNPKALFFDPKADFRLNAQKDNRDMLPMEKFQYDLHKALFADVEDKTATDLSYDVQLVTTAPTQASTTNIVYFVFLTF